MIHNTAAAPRPEASYGAGLARFRCTQLSTTNQASFVAGATMRRQDIYPMTRDGSKHDQGYISSRIFGKEVLAYYQSVHFFACVTIHTVIYDSWKETHLFVVLVKLAMFFSPRWLSSSRRVLAMCATVFAYTARARLRRKALQTM